MTDPKRLAEVEARVARVRRNGTSRAKDNIAYHLIMHQDIPYFLSELRARDAEVARLREALAGVLPYMEAAETAGLVGDEGCHWPVEIVRAALNPEVKP